MPDVVGYQEGRPVVKARVERVPNGRRGSVYLVYITCPYCGKEHQHGGGDGNEPIPTVRREHRVAHCLQRTPSSNNGYFLEYGPVTQTV